MTIVELQNEIIEEFEIFDDWMDKYEHIIEISKSIPLIEEENKTKNNLIDGCQSRVWVKAELNDGKIIFKADSDAIITKGIAALLIRVMNNRTPDEITDCNLFFIEKIGLKENLSPTRSNGLIAMIKQMKLYALAFKTLRNS